MKKSTNLLLAIGIAGLLWTSCSFAYTQEQEEAYEWAYQYRITTQPTIEAANLDWNLTREELAKMLTNYVENIAFTLQASSPCSFSDEDKINDNLKEFTQRICSYKIMWTDGKSFNPRWKVTRAELGTTISRMLWWDRYNVDWKDYFIYHLNALKENWIMNDIQTPNKIFAKRWDTFVMLKRIYDNFGSNINLNNWSTYYEWESDNNDIISNLYANSSVLYQSKDWKKYYYDGNFLKILKNLANKKWESDLKKYLEIESEYFNDGMSQLTELDDDKINEMLWVDLDNIDLDNLSAKEKKEVISKIIKGMNSALKKNEDRNEEYLNRLGDIVKSLDNDKFWLKNKYEKTKEFVENTNTFLKNYFDTIYNILELSVEEWELSDAEWMALVLGLMEELVKYNEMAASYQEYIETWATNTMQLLGLK